MCLKGFYYLTIENYKEALEHYTQSLLINEHAPNYLVLKALKKIEKIIAHRRKIAATKRANSRISRLWNINPVKVTNTKQTAERSQQSQTVYRSLSKHYIQRRSIVFIVDRKFQSVFFFERALDLVKQVFNSLHDEDYFGFLALDETNLQQRIVIEEKGCNSNAKLHMFADYMLQQFEFNCKQNPNSWGREQWLSQALLTAMEWQSSIQDTQKVKNNHVFIGPHKHIVCLVGSCEFSIN